MNDTGSYGWPVNGASPWLALALTVRFLLELALFTGIAMLSWRIVPAGWRWPAAIVAVVVAASVWGLFLSPKATISLPASGRLAIEAALVLGTGAGLLAVGMGTPAAIGVAIWVIDRAVLAFLHQ